MICKYCQYELPEGSAYCCQCGKSQGPPARRPRTRGNGSGTVFWRADRKCWVAQASYYDYVRSADGLLTEKIRRRKTLCGFKTKRDALAALPEIAGGKAQRAAPKIFDLWKQFEAAGLQRLSVSRQTSHYKAFDRLAEAGIVERRIDTLTTSDLQLAVQRTAATYYPARDVKALLSHLFQLAIQDGAVAVNLAQNIVLPTLEEKEAEPFDEAEVKLMWTAWAAGDDFVGYMLLMIYSGMMPGELFKCRVDMIDLTRREIWGCGKKTKIRKESPIVYAAALDPVILQLIDLAGGSGKLWKKSDESFRTHFKAAAERIGVRPLPPYSCRHTTATAAASENIAAPKIQRLMRHAKITTTQRYIHLASDEAHAAADQIIPPPDLAEKQAGV